MWIGIARVYQAKRKERDGEDNYEGREATANGNPRERWGLLAANRPLCKCPPVACGDLLLEFAKGLFAAKRRGLRKQLTPSLHAPMAADLSRADQPRPGAGSALTGVQESVWESASVQGIEMDRC